MDTAYEAVALPVVLGSLEPMAGVEPALRSYQDRGLPLSDTGMGSPREASHRGLFQIAEAVCYWPTRARTGRAPATCTPLFQHPKLAGRTLPLSPEILG